MTYGIQIFNNTNAFVVDDTHPSIVFVGKYTASVGGSGATTGTASFSVSGIRTTPIVFIQNAGSGYFHSSWASIDNGSGNWTIYACARTLSGSLPSTITIYVFDTVAAASASGYGMQVFNSSGTTMFDTNQRSLVISGYHLTSGGSSSSSNSIPNQTLTAGSIPSSWAIASGELGFINIQQAINFSYITFIGSRADSTTISFGPTKIAGSIPVASNAYNIRNQYYLMFIDTSLYQ